MSVGLLSAGWVAVGRSLLVAVGTCGGLLWVSRYVHITLRENM